MNGKEPGRKFSGLATESTGAWQLRGSGVAPLAVLAATVLALGWLFFQMVQPMLLPLFLAGVLAMLVYPWHEKLMLRLKNRDWLSATIFTLLFSALVFVPTGVGLYFAVTQAIQLVRVGADKVVLNEDVLPQPQKNAKLTAMLETLETKFHVDVGQLEKWTVDLGKAAATTLYERSKSLASDVPSFVIAIFIFLFAFFFFLRDGRKLVSTWQRLTPMDATHDAVMRDEFTRVCRAVVWGTLLAAIAQGLLFGIGLMLIEMFAHVGTMKWIFLLTLLATITAVVPFLGASVVWGPLGLYLIWNGNGIAGAFLLVYGIAVVSMADNVVKIYTLGDGASLHPLLVFISVFGGIQMFGVLGMFIGPIIGAVLFALLRVLKQELLRRQVQIVQTGA